jgi:hypothetical protein
LTGGGLDFLRLWRATNTDTRAAIVNSRIPPATEHPMIIASLSSVLAVEDFPERFVVLSAEVVSSDIVSTLENAEVVL